MWRLILLAPLAAIAVTAQNHDLGYDDTPYWPGMKWRVHDAQRPRPPAVTPGMCNRPPMPPPSDAEVLFDGRDVSRFAAPFPWKIENGYMEVVPGKGASSTTESFGDIQLHIEWATPAAVKGTGQNRGNSGVFLQRTYEVQVLDSFENPTYADGQASAIYGQYPPYVNASCRPGEFQSYDIVFEAPRFEGGKVVRPAFITVFHNGVLTQNHEQLLGPTLNRAIGPYKPHGDLPLELQDHNTPVRYRNIWIRRLQRRPTGERPE
jgi:hypothetical protein